MRNMKFPPTFDKEKQRENKLDVIIKILLHCLLLKRANINLYINKYESFHKQELQRYIF